MTSAAQAPASGRCIMIRAADAADHDEVRAVLVASYAQFRSNVGASLHDLYIADLCDLGGRLDGAQLLVATADEAVVGTVTFHQQLITGGFRWPTGWSAIRALGVDPAHRGHGLARWLIEAASALAIENASHTLGLHTATFMTDAIRLYERMGFSRVPHLDIDAGALIDTNGEAVPRVIAYHRPLLPGRTIGRHTTEGEPPCT